MSDSAVDDAMDECLTGIQEKGNWSNFEFHPAAIVRVMAKTIAELREQLAAARVSLDQMRAYAAELKGKVHNPEYAASIQRHIDQAEAK